MSDATTHRPGLWIGGSIVAASLILSSVLAIGGDLNPPAGPVAPTFKTIDETPLSRPVGETFTPGTSLATYVIDQPGRYHLTEDLVGESGKRGIAITSRNVVLDLNGYSIRGITTALSAIDGDLGSGVSDVAILNGSIFGWPGDGIALPGVPNVHVEGVTIDTLGGAGLILGDRAVVRDTRVRATEATGIETERNSLIANVMVVANGGDGVATGSNSIVRDSTISQNQGVGLDLGFSGKAVDNVINDNVVGGIGIDAYSDVSRNVLDFNGRGALGSWAIQVSSTNNRIERNTISDTITGILDSGSFLVRQNVLIANSIAASSALGTTFTDLDATTNLIGPIVDDTNVATSSNPHANYRIVD
jgi:hypothetical protein